MGPPLFFDMNKKLLLVLTALPLLCFCSKEAPEPLHVDSEPIVVLDYRAQSLSVAVGGTAWTLCPKKEYSWISFEKSASGVDFTLNENITGEQRSASFEFTAAEGFPFTLILRQKSKTEIDWPDPTPEPEPEPEPDPEPEPPVGPQDKVPQIFITTDGGALITSKEDYVGGTLEIKNPAGTYGGPASLEPVRMKIRGRGNTTWKGDSQPYKNNPYKIKFEDKQTPFGLGADKEWAIIPNSYDNAFLRNNLAMEVSKILGFSWTPVMYPVEVYRNGEYLGLYDFTEHKKVSKKRINITPIDPSVTSGEALTGDYFFEIDDPLQDGASYYLNTSNSSIKCFSIIFKDPEEPNAEQYAYVKDYFTKFEDALFGASYKDPAKGYAAYIDVNSWVRYFIEQELAKNIDGNIRKSTFITKEKGKKLEMYFVWDFDLAYGNCNYLQSDFGSTGTTNGPTGWYVKTTSPNDYYGERKQPLERYRVYERLFSDPAFVSRVKVLWNEAYPRLKELTGFLDKEKAFLEKGGMDPGYEDVLSRNCSKNGFESWPSSGLGQGYSYSSYFNYLKDFYSQRLSWLNTAINAL